MPKKVIIFGAFITGEKAFQMMRSQYEIIAFSDNCRDYHGKKLFDIPIIPPEIISSLQADLVVIASRNHYAEIARQLTDMGIINLKLFWTKPGTENFNLLDVDGEKPFTDCVYRKLEFEQYDNKKEDLKDCNRKGKRKVLVIAYYFPPAGGSPIQRTLKFVKYMQQYGYEPIVLTTDSDSYLGSCPVDRSLLSDVPEGIRIVRIKDDFTWMNRISKKKSQEIIEFLYSVSDSTEWMDMFMKIRNTQPLYIMPDKLILWANECARCIEQHIDMRDIDLLYSTVPEWSPHLIASFLKMRYGIKWVADYRDPWASNEDYVKLYYPWMMKDEVILDQRLEKMLTRKMDSIIVAGGRWSVDFVTNYGIEAGKIKEITNGYDEADFLGLSEKSEKNEKFTLCYNGGIDYNRNPIPLIKVINTLIEEEVLEKTDIQWIFNGYITDYYLEKMNEEDKYHIVIQNGMLQHRESIQIALKSDVMVMYGEHGEKGVLNYPGKFYEYLRIGRPILCFSSAQSFQNDVLQENGMGVNIDLYDLKGIKTFLEEQITAWKENKNIKTGDRNLILKYERRNLAKRLADEFNRLFDEYEK